MNADARMKANCDRLVELAALDMLGGGASIETIIDRLLTYAAAQSCVVNGSADTAAQFRTFADKIDGGIFHKITGER